MRPIETLIQDIEAEARRAEFPIDRAVYERNQKDPMHPVLYAGTLEAPIAVLGRDLGKDEVARGQPLIGAGGSLVRRGLIETFSGSSPRPDDRWLEDALNYAVLTNTVPYKPPGNKAYPARVKERFRPFVAELLAGHWAGSRVLTLGTEAFMWFSPYAETGAVDDFWSREDRYEADFACEIIVETPAGTLRKSLLVGPLPHPSPLNQRWYGQFPKLLAARLSATPRE